MYDYGIWEPACDVLPANTPLSLGKSEGEGAQILMVLFIQGDHRKGYTHEFCTNRKTGLQYQHARKCVPRI